MGELVDKGAEQNIVEIKSLEKVTENIEKNYVYPCNFNYFHFSVI